MAMLPMTVNNLFKFQDQDSDLEYMFWRFKKHIALPENNNFTFFVSRRHNCERLQIFEPT